MKTVRVSLASALALAALSCAAPASAAITTITLQDLIPSGPTAIFYIAKTGPTYTGNGFVGMRRRNEFIHAFAIELTSSYATRALAQADISAFSGGTINSAVLSFVFLDGRGVYDMKATGFAGTGSVGYQFDAPAVIFSSAAGAVGLGAGSLDVTDIVAQAVEAHATWLDLLTEGLGCCVATFTQSDAAPGNTADSALVRLTVDYTPAGPVGGAVPEPSTWALMLGGFVGLGAVLRARRSRGMAAA